MKRIVIMVLLLALLLCGCGEGGGTVSYHIGHSEQFTRTDIRAAMDVVVSYCRWERVPFTLLSLTYEDDEFYVRMAQREAEYYGEDEAIVILADIHTDPDMMGSLDPDQTYKNYRWILTRTGMERWEIRNAGFA